MKTITIDNLNIDLHNGNIGVAVSGGVDSALLLYIIMKNITAPITIISCGNSLTHNQEPVNALKITNEIMKLTGKKNVYFITHWAENKQLTTTFQKELVVDTLKLDVMYFGFTRPPPKDEIVEFDTQNVAAAGGIDSELVRKTYWSKDEELIDIFGPKAKGFKLPLAVASPFININKKEIAKLYKVLDIEYLYSMTRSCESLTVLDAHCGECWWCKERVWAFGKLV
jgi:7-cyano-7-deazaguanine synthase in queuosine biosynthesis